jgi:hypothetical protein
MLEMTYLGYSPKMQRNLKGNISWGGTMESESEDASGFSKASTRSNVCVFFLNSEWPREAQKLH